MLNTERLWTVKRVPKLKWALSKNFKKYFTLSHNCPTSPKKESSQKDCNENLIISKNQLK